MPKLKEDESTLEAPVTPAATTEQYIVTTDNPEFDGKIMGVPITHGRGLLNRQSIDPRLKRSFEQVLSELSLLPGYHVTPA